MSPCKMFNLFQAVMQNFCSTNMSFMGSGIAQGYGNKVSRPSAGFMINRTQVKTLLQNCISYPIAKDLSNRVKIK